MTTKLKVKEKQTHHKDGIGKYNHVCILYVLRKLFLLYITIINTYLDMISSYYTVQRQIQLGMTQATHVAYLIQHRIYSHLSERINKRLSR